MRTCTGPACRIKLATVLPRLAELGYTDEALSRALAIADASTRANAVASLVPFLPDTSRPDAIRLVLDGVRRLHDRLWRKGIECVHAGWDDLARSTTMVGSNAYPGGQRWWSTLRPYFP